MSSKLLNALCVCLKRNVLNVEQGLSLGNQKENNMYDLRFADQLLLISIGISLTLIIIFLSVLKK